MSTRVIELGEDQISFENIGALAEVERERVRGKEVETDLKVGDAEVDGGNGGVLD